MERELHNKVLYSLAEEIQKALTKTFPNLLETKTPGGKINPILAEIYGQIVSPPDPSLGDLSLPCFFLAKSLKLPPPKIAEMILANMETTDFVKKAEVKGPYLNFSIDITQTCKLVLDEILNLSFFNKKIFLSPPLTMVEYSQPNTHKVLHVGHMRNLCLGNSLSKILNYCGFELVSATYPGDVGTHVAKCLWYIKKFNLSPGTDQNRGTWLGEIYIKATELLDQELGSDKESINRDALTQILKELHAKTGPYFLLWKETREWSLELLRDVYKWARVDFDRWFYESEMDEPSVSLIKEYQEKGLFKEDQGAIGIDLSNDGLGFCILLKSDGTGLYSTKDILLAKRKFEEFKIKKSIYVVDVRQAHHFKQVFKILELMGLEEAKDCFHLQYDVVELPDGAMSSRKGNIVPLSHLISQMEQTIKDNFLNKYRDQKNNVGEILWEQSEIDETARIIAGGAIKYGMIRIDNTRKIIFDMKEWLKLDGETGPYLQYVHARITSLINKLIPKSSGNEIIEGQDKIDWSVLSHPYEKAIILKLAFYNSEVEHCGATLKTAPLCTYLFQLGKLFNSFYAECPIGKAENEQLRKSRLCLSIATQKVLNSGLQLLGIECPPRM